MIPETVGCAISRTRIESPLAMFPLTDRDILARKAFLHLTEEDERHLREVHSLLSQHADVLINRFYEFLLSDERTRRMLEAPGQVERLKALQRTYFLRLTAGNYDAAYFNERIRVGQTHERVGLPPELYMGAYHRYYQIATDIIRSAFPPADPRAHRTVLALGKIITLDMSLAIDAYIHSAHSKLHSRNEELMRLQAAKNVLTNMIIHDLQNPLAGIRAFLELLQSRQPALTASELEALHEALRRCDDLGEMVMNVLQVSRAEIGTLEVNAESLDLADLARRSVAAFALHAGQEGRTLTIDAPRELLIRSDQSLLKRILYNLIRNALRHTPRGTQIVVRVGAAGAGKAEILVSDNGPGIPPDVQHLLFQQHGGEQLRAAGLRVDSGLGLSFCRSAVQALGGTIRVESDGRSGTAFRILLGNAN